MNELTLLSHPTFRHIAVAGNMGVVAVYALNDEFKSILRETKNGMVRPMSYVLSKMILVVPIMFIFAVFALGIPSIVIMDFPGNSFGVAIVLWAVCMYTFECVAECLSVWFDDPIMGMLQFMVSICEEQVLLRVYAMYCTVTCNCKGGVATQTE